VTLTATFTVHICQTRDTIFEKARYPQKGKHMRIIRKIATNLWFIRFIFPSVILQQILHRSQNLAYLRLEQKAILVFRHQKPRG